MYKKKKKKQVVKNKLLKRYSKGKRMSSQRGIETNRVCQNLVVVLMQKDDDIFSMILINITRLKLGTNQI